jgi:hypothetical protein
MPNASLILNADKSTAHWLLKVINTNTDMLFECLFTPFSHSHEGLLGLVGSGPVPAFIKLKIYKF